MNRERILRSVGTALVVCAAYYVGARVGFLLQLPSATTSVLWPPNAILTATLLLTPVRRWWIYILAVIPAHLFVQLGVVEPLPLVGALFATNWSEALIAAACVRAFSDAPARFDTLRRMTIFIVGAGVAAPFVSSFLDAAAVSMLRGEAYWLVWRTRFFSNVLTELTLVPAIVMVVDAGRRWLVATPPRRRIEAALLAVSLAAVGTLVFGAPADCYGVIFGSPRSPLAFLLPFLLWAAVRFGPAGASLSLLSTALLAVWAGSQGGGPFTALPPGENVLALQIFLSVIAIPVLCLSAAIQERRHTESALNERLRFEELLSRLSSAFVHLPADQMDEAIQAWLGRLGEFLGLDRLTLLRLSGDNEVLSVSHSWAAAGIEVLSPGISSRRFPEAVRRLLADAPFVFSHAEAGPPAGARDEFLRRDTVWSNLTIPLLAGGRVLGGIVLDSVARSTIWPHGMMPQLRLVAEVFGSALASRDAESALRASESMKSAILASLTTNVAVLDRAGLIIAVNEQWTRHACERRVTSNAGVGLGASYLDVWRQAALEGRPQAKEALAGIAAVLAGSQRAYSVEYPCSGSAGEQWWAMSVVPLTRPEGGAVVSQTDVTERKRVEIEAQRARQELAHYTRVSTMGELTASLAHELNQPLTGILANAQAARRFLDVTPPDLDELRAILSDIVDDDRRASDVIHRLRDLLVKRELEFQPLDLNVLIRDVARLLSSDALIRNVTLTLDLAPDLPVVNGDRVQLQQVILNLLLNAMEVMSDGGGDRAIIVRTENLESIHVTVQDEGPGLRAGTHELVFQPFYTTKSAGMGMGLAIARSIIEAHAGLIWVTDNPTRGATFHFALPFKELGPE